jgi:hypothetical protein
VATSLNNVAVIYDAQGHTRRPSPFTNGRSRFLKRTWARSTLTWPTA